MEYLDICDENGIPEGGRVERSTAHSNDIRHRTAHVWIIRNRKGEYDILMQKRSDNKDSFPGCYDTSSAGHIPAGDEPLQSALRELSEELGIIADEGELKFAGIFRNHYEMEFYGKPFRDNEVSFVYAYEKSIDLSMLTLQKEEVSEVRWFPLLYVYEKKLEDDPAFCVPIDGLMALMNYLGIDN